MRGVVSAGSGSKETWEMNDEHDVKTIKDQFVRKKWEEKEN